MLIDYIALVQARDEYRRLMRGANNPLDKVRFKRLFRKHRDIINREKGK